MSSKRYLLIAVALWAVTLSAQMTAWVYGSGYHFKNENGEHLTGFDINKLVYVPLGVYNLEFENRFVYTDKDQDERQDPLNDRLQIQLSRNWEKGFAKVFYRGEYYGKNHPRDFFPDETHPIYANRNFNQQIGAKATYDDQSIYAILAARHRTFYYDPMFDHEEKSLETNNINTSATLGVRIVQPISVFVTGVNKQALDSKSDLYDYESTGMGLALNTGRMSFGYIDASTRIEWLSGKHLSLGFDENYNVIQNTERLIPVTSDFRYVFMPTTQIMGYVSYANRSFYDRDQKEMLYNSQFLRASCKYSFPYDNSAGSFFEVGTKYSPEKNLKNRSSMIYVRSEMKVFDRFYLGGGVNHTEMRITRYELLSRYFFSPWAEAFVDYIYTDDIEFEGTNSNTAIGLRMLF